MYSLILHMAGKRSFLCIHCLTGHFLGSCCVDEVAAQHVDADAVVHYGRACMSKWVPLIYPPTSSDIHISQELSPPRHLRLWEEASRRTRCRAEAVGVLCIVEHLCKIRGV